ncbi:MAG: hypothetical protein ABMA13_11425 [Chthoniobacteraceae bacterium]
MKPTKLTVAMIAATFALVTPWASRLSGQPASSLTEQEIESSETKTALEALLRENAQLRQKLQQSGDSVGGLQRNLAVTNTEAEVLKRKVSELILRFEALGLDSAGDTSRLEQRLLKAVSDLRLAEDDRSALRSALIELTEAVLRYQKAATTTDAEVRLALETATRDASKALSGLLIAPAEGVPAAGSLIAGMVIATKDDLALVVANVGRQHGVRAGMPFKVVRGEVEIATVRIVDVRERIAGAVIQDLRSEVDKIHVGDHLKVIADR